MIINPGPEGSAEIRNPQFSAYVEIYRQIEREFLDRVAGFGLELGKRSDPDGTWEDHLGKNGTVFRNDGKSIHYGDISPACVACRSGVGSATYFISLQCNRNCYFCFNPNQEGYAHFQQRKRDCIREMDRLHEAGHALDYVALTGGEPLLHTQETIDFFQHAKELFPEAHIRLYTSGDFVDESILADLQSCALDEIRFSIRLHDGKVHQDENYARMKLAKKYIPSVIVEMPVLPDSFQSMKEILLALEDIGVSSINLLEFCFPFHNAKTFHAKGYKIKNPPYQIPYDYWYAGGLPIEGSELECLKLLEFAGERELKMGVHYCSLENKHTGQVYQQNYGKPSPKRYYFSEKDFLLKSAKVFGGDTAAVLPLLNTAGDQDYFIDTERAYLEFHVDHIPQIDQPDLEIGISSNIIETRGEQDVIRELQIGFTTPSLFDPSNDL